MQFPLSIQLLKHGSGHVNLTPDNEPGQPVRQRHGDGADGFQVFRHILPRPAVSAGSAPDKDAVPVLQRHREAVHLGFQGVGGLLPQRLVHPLAEFRHFFLAEDILKALQRDLVGVGSKALQRFPADSLRGRIRRYLFRMLGFQFFQAAVELVVFVVADRRRVQYIIFVAMLVQRLSQLFDFFAVIHGGLLIQYIIFCVADL